MWITIFYRVSLSTASLIPFKDVKFLPQISDKPRIYEFSPLAKLRGAGNRISEGGTEERESLPVSIFLGMFTSGGRQMFLGIYRYGGMSEDRPSVPVRYNPEVRSTFCGRHVHPEQTCSVIYHSFISFFNSPFLCWYVPYIFMAPLLIFPAHFFCFCNTCLFVTFRTSFCVADLNIILLYSGIASKSISYTFI